MIIHELAHLKHKGHGENFWAAVLNAMPDYKQKRKWLNENGGRLGLDFPTHSMPQTPALGPQ